jgi:uncharacterized protein (TIGR03792 family)
MNFAGFLKSFIWASAVVILLLNFATPTFALRDLDPNAGVVEVLQMPVSKDQKTCWRLAETEIWEPWLEKQIGYQGRELLWDANREQAIVLIGWLNQTSWDAIPSKSINKIEQSFDSHLQKCLGVNATKPLPLQRTGSLQPLTAAMP